MKKIAETIDEAIELLREYKEKGYKVLSFGHDRPTESEDIYDVKWMTGSIMVEFTKRKWDVDGKD